MSELSGTGDDAPPSDAEREELVTVLRRHVADGRLDLTTFDDRVTRMYAATTREQVRAVLADLPPLPASGTGRRDRRRRRRRHGEGGVAPHWVATDEVFRDPTSGRVMRVWIDPADGSRHYAETL